MGPIHHEQLAGHQVTTQGPAVEARVADHPVDDEAASRAFDTAGQGDDDDSPF